AEDGIRDFHVTGVQTCALPISPPGDPTPGDGTASGAAQSFVQAGAAIAKCSGAGCHEGGAPPQFLGAPGRDDDYATIKNFAPQEIGRASCRERGRRWRGARGLE